MLVHLNGQLVEHTRASISIFDRGFLFGDGVYEGLRSTADPAGRPRIIGERLHAQRLREGLAEARITGFNPDTISALTDELLRANSLVEAFIYWQITRGTPPGDAGPQRPRITKSPLTPTVVGFATPVTPVSECLLPEPKRVALRPDTRWTRGRLKSISLLGGVLAAIEADECGADDAIMHTNGVITEATATNVVLSSKGRYVTPSLDSAPMLAGVTRQLLIDADPRIIQKPVTMEELRAADEIMLVGTKTMVAAVTHLHHGAGFQPVGPARPGPAAMHLLSILRQAIARDVSTQR
jgi:D-alanine transaminase